MQPSAHRFSAGVAILLMTTAVWLPTQARAGAQIELAFKSARILGKIVETGWRVALEQRHN
jgi:hypothetical protein